MRSEHPPQDPPIMATWLLERFCADAALAGDLIEEYRDRRSAAWYWKQALIAVSVYSFSQIREHKVLALRAIATGWVIWYVCNNMFLRGVLRPVMDTTMLRVAYMFIGYSFWVANGWVIARLHRPYSTAMVMAYVIWSIVASVPPVYDAIASLGEPNARSLTWEISARMFTVLSLITGGAICTYREQIRQLRPAGQGWRRGTPRAFAAR